MKRKPEGNDALSIWQQRCQAQGLTLTAPRKAILSALLEQSEACDAVPLLQAAQVHYAGTSIGTVYRFLRELQQRGLIDAHAQLHGRTRWQLRQAGRSTDALAGSDIRHTLAQLQDFLRTLERMGLAEASASLLRSHTSESDRDGALAALRDIAARLGYRLLPQRTPMREPPFLIWMLS